MNRGVVVVGGSIAGLGVALALARDGHRVTVLERDAAPLPASPAEAFERWNRRGSPQTRHSHAFLARLHNLLHDREPALLERLLAHGAERMRFREIAARSFPGAELLAEDDEVTLLACRRITFEWVLRSYVAEREGVVVRDGVEVTGVLAERAAGGGPPRVQGVRLRDGTTLEADLVVDASGRRSRVDRWLAEIGAGPLPFESETCGIFYSSRFYRVREGAEMPSLDGPVGADLGFLKYGVFPGDAHVFSVTLAASPDDAPLRALMRQPAFEAVAALLPATREWVDAEVALPVSNVHAMAKLDNARRFGLVDGEPRVLGLVCAGDALIHTNPITGRGCSLAFVSAYLLADALRDHPGDLRAFAQDLEARVEREIAPWYEAMRAQDRDAIEVAAMQRRGEDPFAVNRADGSIDPKAYMRSVLRDGLVPALREDLTVLRAFMRLFNLLEPPADLMANPQLMQRVLASHARRDQRAAEDRGPDRDEVMARLAEVA